MRYHSKQQFSRSREISLDLASLEAIERDGRSFMTIVQPVLPNVQIEHRLTAGDGFPANSFQFTVRGKTGQQVKDALLLVIDAACIEQGRYGFRELGMQGSAAWLKAETVKQLSEQANQKPELAAAMTQAWQKALEPKARART